MMWPFRLSAKSIHSIAKTSIWRLAAFSLTIGIAGCVHANQIASHASACNVVSNLSAFEGRFLTVTGELYILYSGRSVVLLGECQEQTIGIDLFYEHAPQSVIDLRELALTELGNTGAIISISSAGTIVCRNIGMSRHCFFRPTDILDYALRSPSE